MSTLRKYPRTPHLPSSLSLTSDDKQLSGIDHLLNKEVVITEKRDGENTSMYRDAIHARSLDSKNHPSRNYVKKLWGQICTNIPESYRICGENLYAKHSIEYTLESYFEVFSVWDDLVCLSWNDTLEWVELLGLKSVPVVFQGILTTSILDDIISEIDTNIQEGIVVRLASSFTYDQFGNSVAKWVRENHVQTDEHWMHSKIVANKLTCPPGALRL